MRRTLIVTALIGLSMLSFSEAVAVDPISKYEPEVMAVFKPTGRLVQIPVSIGGKLFNFMLDTGTTITLVDSSLKKLLGAEIKQPNAIVNGKRAKTIAFHNWPTEFHIGNLEYGQLKVERDGLIGSTDLSSLRDSGDTETYGVLGMDVLRDLAVLISFDMGGVAIWRDNSVPDPHDELQVPLQFNSLGIPQIPAKVTGGEPQLFSVDTGAMLSIQLPKKQYDQRLKMGFSRETGVRASFGFHGFRERGIARPAGLEVAEFEHSDLTIVPGRDALLGLMYLKRFLVILDFRNRTMRLIPGRAYSYPDCSDHDGIRLDMSTGEPVLYAPVGSPAYRSGLRDGDVAIMINGVPVGETGHYFIRALGLNEIGDVNLIVRRGNSKHEIVLPRPWSNRSTRAK
jgi:Aspartyl protease